MLVVRLEETVVAVIDKIQQNTETVNNLPILPRVSHIGESTIEDQLKRFVFGTKSKDSRQ